MTTTTNAIFERDMEADVTSGHQGRGGHRVRQEVGGLGVAQVESHADGTLPLCYEGF